MVLAVAKHRILLDRLPRIHDQSDARIDTAPHKLTRQPRRLHQVDARVLPAMNRLPTRLDEEDGGSHQRASSHETIRRLIGALAPALSVAEGSRRLARWRPAADPAIA